MEATYFLHHRLILSTRPSLATHRSPSCHGHKHNLHVLTFQKRQSSFHDLTQMGMCAKHNPSSLTIAACSCSAKEDENNNMNRGCPLKRPPALQRAYSFNNLTKGSEASNQFLSILKRALVRDPSESVNEFLRHLMSPKYDPEDLQKLAWELEMNGMEGKAVEMLIMKLLTFERDLSLGEEELILRRLLAELLIYQGEYCYAKVLFESLIGREGSSSEPQLYLAFIYQLMNDTKNARDAWDNFQDANSKLESMGLKNEKFTKFLKMNFADFQNDIIELRKVINRGRDDSYKKGTKNLSLELYINDEFLHH